MLDQKEIESKDFSEAIPNIAAKIHAIGSALMTYGYSEDDRMEKEHCKGFGLFLGEIEDDLWTIWKALYESGYLPTFLKRPGVDGR